MKKILVIEDNEGNLELIKVVLEMAGYQVMGASDASVGLSQARINKPDLILMDMHLPGMDGYQATRILKKDKELKDIPVIAVTAICDTADERKIAKCGCSGWIDKPVDTRKLPQQIEVFINQTTETRSE